MQKIYVFSEERFKELYNGHVNKFDTHNWSGVCQKFGRENIRFVEIEDGKWKGDFTVIDEKVYSELKNHTAPGGVWGFGFGDFELYNLEEYLNSTVF